MTGPETFARPRDGESFEDFQTRYRASIPPVVYLPTARAAAEGEPLELELRTTTDGKLALLAYSAFDRFVDCCGPHQPYALLATANLDRLKADQPYDVVYFDMVIPDELRHAASGPSEASSSPREVGDHAGPGRRTP